MATITEDYVSFETAKLLKEKGFDNLCSGYYNQERVLQRLSAFSIKDTLMSPFYFDCVPAPTHQMAMKWLREVYNTNIDIVPVWNQKRFEYQVFIVTPENAKHCYVDDKLYLVYEEAVEAAILYCLEKLI